MAAFLFYDESKGSAIRVNWVQNESSISIGHAHISVDVKQGDDYVSSHTTAHISPPTDRPAPHLMPQHCPQPTAPERTIHYSFTFITQFGDARRRLHSLMHLDISS